MKKERELIEDRIEQLEILLDTYQKAQVKIWGENIEDEALSQASNVLKLPFINDHIAILPDCHFGYGVPIGCVFATRNVIIPNAVGVDIGCGVSVIKTSLTEIGTEDIKHILSSIRKKIPLGMTHHKEKQNESLMPPLDKEIPKVEKEYNKALYQIGSLGGGNHFIEIQKGSDGYIWFMVHSGSRNLGFVVANHYNKIAVNLNKTWFSSVPASYELAFLPLDTKEGQLYFDEMTFCKAFGSANRKYMMDIIKESFLDKIDCTFDETIDVPHNFAALENHFGKNSIVHRKGATRARKDEICIIPGSQGTKSYIVIGKGNKESFESCSHGAGRCLSRKKARDTLNLDDEIRRLNEMDILHSIRNKKDLDEAPSAYKDISEVIKSQEDLVDVLVELTPLAVIKG